MAICRVSGNWRPLARLAQGPRGTVWAASGQILDTVSLLCAAYGLPMPEREVVFLADRKFRADYCWRMARVILEVDGSTWTVGGHSTGKGIQRDMEKSNLAQLDGWIYLRATPQQVTRGSVLAMLEQVLR